MYHANEKTVRAAFDYIEKTTAAPAIKAHLKKIISILFVPEKQLYKPGDTIYLSSGKGPLQSYLICVTGSYKGKLSVRFCNTSTGMKAGRDNQKAYQYQTDSEGISTEQIEEYFDFIYKVVQP
jgi:hypothetical protein